MWVPGVLGVDVEGTRGRLVVGPLDTFWDGQEDVTDWKTLACFVRIDDLGEDVEGLIHPHALTTREKHPRVSELIAHAPLLEILSDDVILRLREKKVPLYEVGFARNADDYFTFVFGTRTVSGAFINLESTAIPEEELEFVDRALLADRILRAASDGVVDGRTVSLARELGTLCASPPSERALDELEQELAEIETRAAAQRDDARRIADAIHEATADEIAIPTYGRARRIHHPALVLRDEGKPDDALSASVSIDGAKSLTLPARDEWIVEDVEPWQSSTRLERIAMAAHRARFRRQDRNAKLIVLAVAAMLLGFFLLGVLLSRRR